MFDDLFQELSKKIQKAAAVTLTAVASMVGLAGSANLPSSRPSVPNHNRAQEAVQQAENAGRLYSDHQLMDSKVLADTI